MKFLLLSIFIMVGFNACTNNSTQDQYYDRASSASEKSFNKLDKE